MFSTGKLRLSLTSVFKNLARNTARNTARFWPARSNFCTNCHEVDLVKARNTGMTRIRPESGQNLVHVRNGPNL